MNSEVIISIKNIQRDAQGEENIIEECYEGTYSVTGGKQYLMYSETDEAGKITKTLIKIGIGEITVTKRGNVNVEMNFKRGIKKLSNYETAYGGFTMGFSTKNLSCTESEKKIDLIIDYTLDINYEFQANCQMKISVDERPS